MDIQEKKASVNAELPVRKSSPNLKNHVQVLAQDFKNRPAKDSPTNRGSNNDPLKGDSGSGKGIEREEIFVPVLGTRSPRIEAAEDYDFIQELLRDFIQEERARLRVLKSTGSEFTSVLSLLSTSSSPEISTSTCEFLSMSAVDATLAATDVKVVDIISIADSLFGLLESPVHTAFRTMPSLVFLPAVSNDFNDSLLSVQIIPTFPTRFRSVSQSVVESVSPNTFRTKSPSLSSQVLHASVPDFSVPSDPRVHLEPAFSVLASCGVFDPGIYTSSPTPQSYISQRYISQRSRVAEVPDFGDGEALEEVRW